MNVETSALKKLKSRMFAIALVLGWSQHSQGAATSLPLRAEAQGQTVEVTYGNSLLALPFSGTTTYHFYSPPLSESVNLTTADKAGGVIYMRNTGGSTTDYDFSVLGRMQYFDCDPATGIETLLGDTGNSPHKDVNHGQTVNWAIPNQNLPADAVFPAGHVLHVVVTVTLRSGNPGSWGQLLYNGPSGTSTVALFSQSSAITWEFRSIIAGTHQPDGSFVLTCSGSPGASYFVQATTNLVPPVWVNLGSATADTNGICTFIDRDATNYPCRFYRTVASY